MGQRGQSRRGRRPHRSLAGNSRFQWRFPALCAREDVYKTLLGIMQGKGGMSEAQAQRKMKELQAAGRYVTEVY